MHDYGAAVEPEWRAWLDVFLDGMLMAWYEQVPEG